MNDVTIDEMFAAAGALNVRFYTELAPDGLFLRAIDGDKLVLRVYNDAFTFYDQNEVDIFTINEFNEATADDDYINSLLDEAWGEEGFGLLVQSELTGVVLALEASDGNL